MLRGACLSRLCGTASVIEPIPAGTRVRLANLKHAPRGRIVWRVVACACDGCRAGVFVAVDEEGVDGGQRHVGCGGLLRDDDIDRTRTDEWADFVACNGGQALAWSEEANDPGVALARSFVTSSALTDSSHSAHYVDESTIHHARRATPARHNLHKVLPHVCPDSSFGRELMGAATRGTDGSLVARWCYAVARLWGVDTVAYSRAVQAQIKG